MNSGIYKITNLVTNDFYIGSAVHFKNRWKGHYYDLRHNKHHSIILQRSYNKYGEDKFKFSILAKCPKEYLIKLEQWFINNLQPKYNICKIAGSCLGIIVSKETRDKQSLIRKGKKHTMETRTKMKGNNVVPILQFDPQNKFIREWPCALEASTFLKINNSHIIGCCRGKFKMIGGYKWKYKDENYLINHPNKTKIKI